ncbi:MAG: hypothetical protein BalsKO_28500 [Balneolaceae bacterium]
MSDEIKYLTNDSVSYLVGKLEEKEQREKYHATHNFDLSNLEFLDSSTGIIFDENFKLINGIENDAINAINIHKHLNGLDKVQANDKRLWVTLAHTKFFSYSVNRWSISRKRAILDRFFYEGSGIRVRGTNSISRLWWVAELTFDGEREDMYELTKAAFSMQDLFWGVFNRRIGTYTNILKTWISIAKKNKHLGSKELQLIPKGLNAIGGNMFLGSLDQNEIKKFIFEIADFHNINLYDED